MVGLPVILRRVLNRLVNSVAKWAPPWCARGAAVWLLVLCLAGGACADTIVLKNGRRIVGETVTQENGKVTCETATGLVTIPESMVARIERDDLGATAYPQSNVGAASLSMAPPPADKRSSMDEVSRQVVHDGAIDRVALTRLEAAAASGRDDAMARAAAANSAAGQFALIQGDISGALEDSERALTFAPGQVPLLLNVAYLRLRLGEYKDALDLLDRARRGAPDSSDVFKLTGWADYGLNRLEQAVSQWKRAQELRPDPDVAQALAKAERDFEVESQFSEGESAHFVLRYNGSAAPELARAILMVLEDDFQTIASVLDFAPKEPIAVILYTSQAFGDITRAPSWVGALNDGRIRIPVQGLVTVTPELARVLKHELTHSFVTEKTQGRSPVWLQEGVAQWMEGKRSGDAAARLVALYDHQQDPSLTLLEGNWLSLPGDVAGVAYAWSLAVVEAMQADSSSGEFSNTDFSNIDRLLEHIRVDPTAEVALRSSQHMDYPELTRATAEYLRRTYLHR